MNLSTLEPKPLIPFRKQKSHVVYKTKDGERVPGASTIAKIGDNPEALIAWAWRLGTEGQDYRKVRDTAADIGSLAHFLIQCYLRGEQADISEFAPADVSKAETCFLKFLEFWQKENLTMIATEIPLVSEEFKFGGTLDTVALDGGMVLLDYKSGNTIWDAHLFQLSAYEQLWNEYNPHELITRRAIIRIGREEVGDMEIRWMPDMRRYFDVFLTQLAHYKARKLCPKLGT